MDSNYTTQFYGILSTIAGIGVSIAVVVLFAAREKVSYRQAVRAIIGIGIGGVVCFVSIFFL